jgi:uncharacterized protein YjbI with pentapeptide repeats
MKSREKQLKQEQKQEQKDFEQWQKATEKRKKAEKECEKAKPTLIKELAKYKENPDKKIQLVKKHLSKYSEYQDCLIGLDISGLNLNGLNLSKLKISNANLSGCNLIGTKFDGCILDNINLNHLDLSGCDLSNTTLTNCTLVGTDLSKTICRGTQFNNCILDGIKLGAEPKKNSVLCNSRITGGFFHNVDFNGSNSGIKFDTVNLKNINLSGCQLWVPAHGDVVNAAGFNKQSTFKDCTVDNMDLRGASNAHLEILEGTFLSNIGAGVKCLKLSESKFTSWAPGDVKIYPVGAELIDEGKAKLLAVGLQDKKSPFSTLPIDVVSTIYSKLNNLIFKGHPSLKMAISLGEFSKFFANNNKGAAAPQKNQRAIMAAQKSIPAPQEGYRQKERDKKNQVAIKGLNKI